jgi:hypothetical protein
LQLQRLETLKHRVFSFDRWLYDLIAFVE